MTTSDDERITMKILRNLSDAVDDVIDDEDSVWRSKQDFIEEAVREKLRNYDLPKLEHVNTYDDRIRLKQAKRKSFVELFIKSKKLVCSDCEASKCYHIRWVWGDKSLAEELKTKGAKSPF